MELEEIFLDKLWTLLNSSRDEELLLSTKESVDIEDIFKSYHEAKLKLLNLHHVSQRSELVDFMTFLFENWQPRRHLTAEMLVDGYLGSTCG